MAVTRPSKSIPTDIVSNAGFFTLPLEIRLQVFRYALRYQRYKYPVTHFRNRIKVVAVADKFKNTHRIYRSHNGRQDIVQKALVLSQVCRRFHQEIVGEGLIYKLNSFDFNTPSLMNRFFAAIQPRSRNLIRKVTLKFRVARCSDNMQIKVFKALATCSALKELVINVHFDFSICRSTPEGWNIPDGVLDCFGKFKGFKEVRGLQTFGLALIINKRRPGRGFDHIFMSWFDFCEPQGDDHYRYLALFNTMKEALTRPRDVDVGNNLLVPA